MQEPTHLNVFDFDDTLFRTPNYTVSEAVGVEPYDWFDSPESLHGKFSVRGIANTIARTFDPQAVSMLVTHRVEDCRDEVLKILYDNQIELTEVHFLGRGSTKASCVLKAIEGTAIETVTIFEDTLWELLSYALAFDEAKISQEVDFVFVDKSKIINISWSKALELARSVQVEKLKLA